MKYGVCYCCFGKDWEGDNYPKTIERVRAAGLDILEIFYSRILTMSQGEIDEINAAARANDVEIYCLGGFGPENDLSQRDESGRKRAVEKSKEILKAIDRLHAKNFSGINYSQWMCFDEPENKAERFDICAKSLHEVGKAAENYGISWNMEVINRFENYLLNTAAEGRAMAEAADSDAIRILLDSFHGMVEEDSLSDAVRTGGDKIGHYHIGSNNRKLPHPGGFVPYEEIAEAMKEIGYDRAISIEPLLHQGGTVALSGGNVWRPMTPEGLTDEMLDGMLKESAAYVKSIFG